MWNEKAVYAKWPSCEWGERGFRGPGGVGRGGRYPLTFANAW